MKKLLLALLTVFLCTSCLSKKEKKIIKEQEEVKELAASLNIAKNSPIVIDTIFLDYHFGMSRSDVSKHSKKLSAEGKIKINSDGNYTYDINLEKQELVGDIKFGYHDDKLCAVRVVFKSDDETYIGLCAQNLFSLVWKINPLYKPYIIKNESTSKYEYFLIKNNLVVIVKSLTPNEITIAYANAPIEKPISEANKKDKHDYKSDF